MTIFIITWFIAGLIATIDDRYFYTKREVLWLSHILSIMLGYLIFGTMIYRYIMKFRGKDI